MSLLIDNPAGATALSPDDLIGLKLPHIQTRAQLNEVEAANILQGQMWISRINSLTIDDILDREFIVALHQKLFGEVWVWAGKFRQRELNIGVDPNNISVDLYNFLEDAKYWIEYKHFSTLELSVRIHHRLVQIHPFANGNGRHSRIFTDVVRVFLLDERVLTWANAKLEDMSEERAAYIEALRAADAGSFSELEYYLRTLGNQ
ncbi:MAG: mobile mystery protein B [Idiomarina sp.]